MFFKADKDWKPVQCDVFEWAEWFNDVNNRIVRKTQVREDIKVSTIFLGLATLSLDFSDMSLDNFFETMVFAPDKTIKELKGQTREQTTSILALVLGGIDFQKRYKTVADAIEGHDATVMLIKKLLVSKN